MMPLLELIRQHLKSISGKEDEETTEPLDPNLRKFFKSLNYNPMMNHIVLSTVFMYSSRKDLLRFRLVCKTWHKEATSHLLVRNPIHRVVTRESELTKLFNLTKHSNSFPIQSFYIKIPSITTPPHALFKTLSLPCIVCLKIVVESKHFPGTVRTIGAHMRLLKYLAICRIPEPSFEDLGAISISSGGNVGKLPCLVSLSLRNAKPCSNFLATYDGAVVELLKAAHGNLKSLEFRHWGLLTKIFREGNFSGISNLRVVGGKLSEADIMVLIGKKELLLDSFSARVDKNVSKYLVKEFLDKRVGGEAEKS